MVAAVVALATVGYQLATTGARDSAVDNTSLLEPESRAPRLIPQSAEGATEGRGKEKEAEQAQPEDTPPRFRELPVDQLLALAVHSASAWTRADALEELVTRRSNQALPVLLDRLADPDGDVRRAAADGLAELGNRAAVAALERALPAEVVEKTRLAMAQAIVELRPSGGTPGVE